ncbi:hypothetical protein BX666DRAFT_2016546 [Dichotomocladium elegans]|nr:hypothetical protein BX666DRAFT_2016546 [Dichotomocladium elegans]
MDFASAPLEALLMQNAATDQLETYIDQLNHHFRETAKSEKERFGALQILLPSLKAYLMRLDTYAEREAILQTYLEPLIRMSFKHDSMVATESVSMLSDSAAFWMVRSMEGHDDEEDMDTFQKNKNNFGRANLLLFLGQLLLAMESEPDFVDLQPVRYIESCLTDPRSEEWNALHLHVNALIGSHPTLDLECCLDVISRFVTEVGDKDKVDVTGWMDVVMAIAVAMLPCTDAPIQTKLMNDLIPNVFRWQHSQPLDVVPLEKRNRWAEEIARQMLWKRITQIFGLPATNLLRSETYGFIANGLRSNESIYRKYSAYVLKRIIDFTSKYPNMIPKRSWTRYFQWSVDDSELYSLRWADWFLLYEIMHETVIHLVEPVLPRFERLLTNDHMTVDPSWWILLFHRGFQNDTASVKKGILEYIFSLENAKALRVLGAQNDFIFGALLKTVDVMALYSVPTQGTLVSPFGEKLKGFMYRLTQVFDNPDQKVNFLSQLIQYMSHVLNGYIPILFILEAISEADGIPSWAADELKAMRYLVDRHRNFQIPKSKLYLRKLAIRAVIKFANTSKLSFSDVAKTVSSLITDFPIRSTSEEYKLIQGWLEESVAKDKSLDTLLHQLKERADAYISTTASDEEEGRPKKQRVTLLFNTFTNVLKDVSISLVLFNRLLILLDSIWDIYDVAFDGYLSLLMGLNIIPDVLRRIDDQYLSLEANNVTDDNMLRLFISMTRHILKFDSSFEDHIRRQSITDHYHRCVELLKQNGLPPVANREMTKVAHVQLLGVLYDACMENQALILDCDDKIANLLCAAQLRKTPEALQVRSRTWGDTLSEFIRCKWESIEMMIRYASERMNRDKSIKVGLDDSFLDPEFLFQEGIEQLECASELCATSVMSCVGEIISMPWEKSYDMVEKAIEYSIGLINENLYQSKAAPPMMRAIIRMVFQPELLSRPALNNDGGPIKRALQYILELGELKPFIVTQCVERLHAYWSTHTPEADDSMLQYIPEIAKLLIFGPLRDRDDQKLEAAVAYKLEDPAIIHEAENSAEIVFTQNDYMARVYLNDLILRLDKNNDKHVLFAERIMDALLDEMSNDKYKCYQFLSTIEHRSKLRLWCSLMLLHRFVTENTVDHYVKRMSAVMKGETQVSVRCYMEWIMIRLYLAFPNRLTHLYSLLDEADTAPHHTVSILTVILSLGFKLDDTSAKGYFDEIFPRIIQWLTSNNFTVRLYAYCAWFRNLKACRDRGLNPGFDKNQYMVSLIRFMENYSETSKFKDKFESQFYMTEFDPIEDFNIEFIFRQLMSVFGVIDNEKIASRAFYKVNPNLVDWCPFTNPKRKRVYTSVDPNELLEEPLSPTKKYDAAASNASEEASYQKKIMPWEMMLETDVDLTKSLVQKKRRRNDLIVVASLVDRLPNLAGLCRTCEIFNAALLVVYSIKIKDDPQFTSISVASERWMPMMEVGETDIPDFLEKKKAEGYTLCGLEQTTTSATLGEYDFPERCVLLLGKERQGIPANLLQMLDQTIEIPQQGITRSLNVHVSGAICIYEYTKQMQWRQ